MRPPPAGSPPPTRSRRGGGSGLLAAGVTMMVAGVVTLSAAGALIRGLPVLAQSPTHAQKVRRVGPAPVARTSPTPTPTPAPTPPPVTTTRTLDHGGLQRSYVVVQPGAPAVPSLPAIVYLHGQNAAVQDEMARDGLLPYMALGQVVLVYPVGYEQSWNAGACCGKARTAGVDDAGFVAAVLQQVAAIPGVDPTRITLAGYSNGGKLAFDLACERPTLAADVVVIDAVAISACPANAPVSLLLIAGTADPEIPFPAGAVPVLNDGVYNESATDQADQWAQRDACPTAPVPQTTGALTTQRWGACAGGTTVELAGYAGATHLMPTGDAATPGPGQVIWEFATGS